MTYREKLRMEHPEVRSVSIMNVGCPHDYGYDTTGRCALYDRAVRSCKECWDREIPRTEIKKETYIMPTHDMSVNTKRTKAELIDEIKLAHEHIQEMQTRLERMDKYKQYEECADEMKAIHTAFVNSGFTNEQAFDLMKTVIQGMIPSAMRGMSL